MAGRKIVIEFLGDSKDLQKAMGDAESKSGKLSGTLGKVGKVAAVGLGAGVALGAKALFDMTKGAIEDDAAQKKLATTLKNTTGATDKQIGSVENWISAQGKALGVTDDELRPALEKLASSTGSVQKAQEQASLAMDVAAGRGLSLEAVSKALERANNGNVAGLSRLGIETKNAAGDVISMEEATRRLADTYEGQAAAKAATLEGKMARLKLILAETGETIGSKLIPMVTNVADWFLNKGLPAVSAFGGWLQDNLGPIFERVRAVVSSVMGGMQGDVGGKLGQIRSTFESVTSIITSLWDRFGGTLTDFTTKTFNNVKQVIGGALTVIQGVFQTFAALLKGDWSGAWDGVKKILSGALEIIKGVLKQGMNVLGTVTELGWSAIKGIISGVWDGIKTLVTNGARDVVGWIADIPGKLREKAESFRNAGGALIGAFVDGIKNAGGVIEGIAGNVWSAVKSLLNGAIDKINAALEFTISLPGPDIHVDVGNIGHLAKGTRNWRGGLTWVGEEGPELLNLPRGSQVTPHGESMAAMAGGAGGATVVQLVIGAKVVEQLLIQHTRDTGRPLQVRTLGPA